MIGSSEHPIRYELVNEMHARPFQASVAPERITHYALLRGESEHDQDRAHVASLCQRFGAALPPVDANHYAVDLGQVRLKWERHTEFTTYTFFQHGPFEAAFEDGPAKHVPAEWLSAAPGELIVATHVAMLSADESEPSAADLSKMFVRESLTTSRVSASSAQVWTDFRVHGDGHSRILIHNETMPERKAGRIIQRILEIETYRMMALLGLPPAREAGPRLSTIDGSLAHLTLAINALSTESGESEAALLRRLTRLSADIETLSTTTAFRFSATQAYYALVRERVAELREERIEGFQTIAEFIDRRLAPAVRTCEAVSNRIGDLSRRATRTADLMRTRVDFALQEQNQELLSSMERRARVQLRLQETVEGLSVAAVSYYAVGLAGYVLQGGEAFLPGLDSAITLAALTPLAIAAVWIALRRFRRRPTKSTPER